MENRLFNIPAEINVLSINRIEKPMPLKIWRTDEYTKEEKMKS